MNIENCKVMVAEEIELPLNKDIIKDDTYIRVDLDGKKRNLVYISKI